MPVWAAAIGAVVMLVATDVLPLSAGRIAVRRYRPFALIAVPLFILTGDVLVRTGLSNKLLDVADATTGGFRAGLGTATVLGCGFFACISGSDAAGAAAVGRMTIHKLVEKGYPRPYACALVASGACTGILIPPSIAYIIIGLILGISASTLFLAAAIPGVLIMVSIMVTNMVMNQIHGYEGETPASTRWRGGWDGRSRSGSDHPGRHLFGHLHADRGGRRCGGDDHHYRPVSGQLTLADFPKMLVSWPR